MEQNIKIGPIHPEWPLEGQKILVILMSIQELKTKDPKYSDWISENMLVINWILNSMEKELQAVSNIVKEFWESIEAAYVQKEIMHEYSS